MALICEEMPTAEEIREAGKSKLCYRTAEQKIIKKRNDQERVDSAAVYQTEYQIQNEKKGNAQPHKNCRRKMQKRQNQCVAGLMPQWKLISNQQAVETLLHQKDHEKGDAGQDKKHLHESHGLRLHDRQISIPDDCRNTRAER